MRSSDLPFIQILCQTRVAGLDLTLSLSLTKLKIEIKDNPNHLRLIRLVKLFIMVKQFPSQMRFVLFIPHKRYGYVGLEL